MVGETYSIKLTKGGVPDRAAPFVAQLLTDYHGVPPTKPILTYGAPYTTVLHLHAPHSPRVTGGGALSHQTNLQGAGCLWEREAISNTGWIVIHKHVFHNANSFYVLIYMYYIFHNVIFI